MCDLVGVRIRTVERTEQIVQQEANAQSKGGDAGDFESRVVISVKGGSYDVPCPAGAPPSCVFGYYRSAAGRITLPYKQKIFPRTAIVLRSFVFGSWHTMAPPSNVV